MGDLESVRVALRVRPLVQLERDRGCQEAVERTSGLSQVSVNRTEAFTFNYVFDASNTQEQVYTESVSEMLDKLLNGFNATILAYGQTGSGKTHTMGTAFSGELDEDVGVIPRAMHDIFERIERLSGESNFEVTVSFMELYQEQLYDLLSKESREKSVVEMREYRNGIIMPGLTEERVHTARETTDCLLRGSAGRAVASTAMNATSSRSHAIFTVTIQATKNDEMKSVTTSKFHLVDLAGSERSKKTQATGDRFKEGVKINQGLLALGNVISALGEGKGSGFVRYRDSKLTRLLQDSLGGNSVTLMIACVSPADYNVPETLSTLRYADRARKIKNKPIVNQDPHAAEVNQLKGIIQKLRMELLVAGGSMSGSLNTALQGIATSSTAGCSSGPTQAAASIVQSKVYQQLQEKYRNLQQQLQLTLHDVAENEMRAHIAEAAHEKLKAKTDEMKGIVDDLARDFCAENETESTDAVARQQLRARVQQIQQLVNGLDEELERTQSEITEHKRRCSNGSVSLNNSDGGDEDDDETNRSNSQEMKALLQEHADAYTNKQIGFKEQLRRINRELNIKEDLHQRVAGNLTKFCNLDDNIEEKYQACESKIQELEAEKCELVDKLRHVRENTSAKLAEERRKRLQTLELEISDMKRKNTQQAKLLKVREKERQKIVNLHSEIQAMKESKVKLIRAMRQESENFRQWKLTREKEVMQLKNKDRKMQNEMARKEQLHNKQRNVLKRKCEEAMAINKRLKDALDRQKVAQTQRQKQQSSKDITNATTKIDQLMSWVERELEVIISLIDAEHSLEQLIEDRGIIGSRIADLQQHQNSSSSTTSREELPQLQEELEMRNAQIADLQQKVCVADLETRMEALCDGIQSVSDARATMKHLLKIVTELRREHANRLHEQRAAWEEQRALAESAEQRCANAAKRMRLLELENEEAIAERENTYEEKIAVLLRELHNSATAVPQMDAGAEITPDQEERLKIQEEQLNKMDAQREELEAYKTLVAELQQAVQAKRRVRNSTKAIKIEEEVIECDEILSSGEDFDNSSSDPDWRKTPAHRRVHKNNKRTSVRSTSSVSTGATLDETYAAAASAGGGSGGGDVTAATTVPSAAARTSGSGKLKRKPKSCSCRGNCSNKRCGCYSSNERCALSCRCRNTCSNGKLDNAVETPNADDDDADAVEDDATVTENRIPEELEAAAGAKSSSSPSSPLSNNGGAAMADSAFVKPTSLFETPKIARLSTITFDTASAKKKFFE